MAARPTTCAAYDFLSGDAPDTVNPSLWRQAQILTQHGLFKVPERIFQVRGFDVSTVTFIDAGAGWIVVDPLTTVEVATAALELVGEHRGAKAGAGGDLFAQPRRPLRRGRRA